MSHLNGNIQVMANKVDNIRRAQEQLARLMTPIFQEIEGYLSGFIYETRDSFRINENEDILFFNAFGRQFEVRLDSRWDTNEVRGRIAIYIDTNEGMLCFEYAEFGLDGEVPDFTLGEKDDPDPLPITKCSGILVAHWLLNAHLYYYQDVINSPS